MSDARWIEVAQAVSDEINDNSWSQDFVAHRSYADWTLPLEILDTLFVDVVPVNNPKIESDGNSALTYKVEVDIVVRYKFGQEDLTTTEPIKVQPAKVDPYSYLVDQLLRHFWQLSLDDANANWVDTEILQTHGNEALAKNQQFTGLVRLVFDAPVG